MSEQVPVGQVLSLREAFYKVMHNAERRADVRKQAAVVVQLLDELIERREKDAANG